LTPEVVASQFSKVNDFSKNATFPESNQEMMEKIMTHIEEEKNKP
jgi:hypothetical protein